MNLEYMEYFCCPGLRPTANRCGGELAFTDATAAPTLRDGDEIEEGLLVCRECSREYPVIAGVLFLVDEAIEHIRQRYSQILRIALELAEVSPSMLRYLSQQGCGVRAREFPEPYLSMRALTKYLTAHYDDLNVVLGSSHAVLSRDALLEGNDPYCTTIKLASPLMGETDLAIDLGANVGGAVAQLSTFSKKAIGVDISFRATLLARKILIGKPGLMRTYEMFLDGDNRAARPLQAQHLDNVEFVVADASNLPFRAGSIEVAAQWNLLDVVNDPRALLAEQARVLRSEGLALISTPFCWELERTRVTEQVGGVFGRSSTAELRLELDKSGLSLLAEALDVPWILRLHDRRIDLYSNDCVVARKR